MHKTAFIFLSFLLPVAVFSQDEIKSQDPLAVPFLENISKNFKTDLPYQAEFRYEIYSPVEDAKISDYGSIIVKGIKYKLKTEDAEVYFNGEHLWVYNIANAEVYKSTPTPGNMDQMLADPFRLLGNYSEYYKYLYKGKKTINGITYSEIDLYPIDLNSGYSILKILCSENGKNIYSITLKQKNGTEITAYLNEIIRNLNIKENTFTWDESANPEVMLIEM